MSQDKKVAAETKLTEEEKLFEEKKVVNPYIAGLQKQIQRILLRRYWRACLKILVTVIVMTRKVGAKILRIGPGDQVIRFLVNRPSNKVILRT
jgi:hypothetical protein